MYRYRLIQSALIMMLLALPLGHPVAAQDLAADGIGEAIKSAGNQITWQVIFAQGGVPLKIIVVLSVFVVALVVYLLVILRTRQVVPAGILQELVTRIQEGELNEARLVCSQKPCPVGAVTLAALNYIQSVTHVDASLLKDVMEAEGRRQADGIRDPTRFLLDVGAIAPMVGMLGTVLGMLQAFQGLIFQEIKVRPVILAHGVSMALITTIAGLIVAIPAMTFYAYFRSLAGKRVSQLEAASMEVLTSILRVRENDELS
ncbi:MAG: MotA/TolQ/ExbB proton channel family protein [Verrucomicrobia bacterium]|nr:MotA/TolQ/ExbB proton channel family protein [Verrucomicrobiota bacterium]MDA1085467.1 MotA/TolQ/ExbB proton channel family protein [Verrucomicrobiota bacterium]